MDNLTTIRLELGIDARKFIQQVQIQNKLIEDQISKGIELALNDITQGDNFIQAVREVTKKELAQVVNKAILSWDMQYKIQKLIADKIGDKVHEYADKIAEQVTSTLNPKL